ncbi:hypothetical protein BFC17_20765 [Alteromonas lipolytica]|uniref:histidine kinase n=2 Tax=Alteromonas lipolytica TaxID=1856405 RepID=A0A1E8FDJ0_9ALTE|nr:hypothetical protein BFC17_20765 [Alteromonas lipolytica]
MSATTVKRTPVHQSIIKSVWLPLLVIVAGYFYALNTDERFLAEQQQLVDDNLSRRLQQITEAVNERVSLYAYGLGSLKASISAMGVENLRYSYVNDYAQSQNYSQQYPGARGFGFIRKVPPQNLDAFLAMVRNDRPDKQFELRTLTPHQNSHFIIQYIMPEQANLQAIGLDIGSETMRRNSAEQAARTNSTQLTAPITLVQANQKASQGFLILQPVFPSLVIPSDPVQRMAAVAGWSYAPLLIDEVLTSVSGLREDVKLSIEDVTNGEPELIFGGEAPAELNDFNSTTELTLFGRIWRLRLTPNQPFIDALRLPSKNQAFNTAMSVTTSLALVIFSLQIVFRRRADAKNYERELAIANQRALELNNEKLEQEVAARTDEINQANILQRRILESAGYALIATDETGIITAFNPAAERLIGYSAAEMVGKQTPEVFHLREEMVERAKALSEELGREIKPGFDVFIEKLKDGKTASHNWTYVRKDSQQVPVRLSATSLFDENGKVFGFLGIAYDLTLQLQREKELHEARLQAEKANEAKSSFLANMSHEIRTPLNGIYGALQLLQKPHDFAERQSLLDNAIRSTRNLSRIINDILDFSKIEAGKVSIEQYPFSLGAMLDGVNSDLLILLGDKPVELIIENSLTHDQWIGDAVRIRQVLLNIGANAIKFTERGKVCITVRESSQERLIFSITDTGAGMSEDALTRLFDRFEQADSSTTRKHGGTGLGMSITQSLIHLMGGEIRVASTTGEGTKFVVTLPMQPAEETEMPEETTVVVTELDLSGETILVAEDNDINRAVIAAMLAETKAAVYFAVNGQEAVEFVEKKRPDIVLMDIQMPVMDGVEACQQIKAMDASLPVIAVTANAMGHDISRYLEVGFDSYLSKPVDLKELINVLAQYSKPETA